MMMMMMMIMFLFVVKAVMTGNTLPDDLNLLDLVLVSPRQPYVIINGYRSSITTTTTTTTTTRRPVPPEHGSVTFTSGRSYLRLPQWSPGRRGRIEFNFKTIQRHGVMLVTSPSPGRSDFFAIEISDGDLYALFNLGGQTKRYLVGTGVDDGQQHYVRIDRNGRSLWLTLDNEQLQGSLPEGGDGSLDVGSTLFVGGTSNKEQLPWRLYSRRRDNFYRGCIWDLRLDSGDIVELRQLWTEQGMPGLTAGCAAMPFQCSARSCENGGICRELWGGHLCDCAFTSFTDTRCQRGQLSLAFMLCLSLRLMPMTHSPEIGAKNWYQKTGIGFWRV